MKWPLLPAPGHGRLKPRRPYREPPPGVTLGEKLVGLNVPRASQVQETLEGRGHRVWLAAASQARSGCGFGGGGIGARPGLLSSRPPVGWLRGSLLTTSFDTGGRPTQDPFQDARKRQLGAELPSLKNNKYTKIVKEVTDGIMVIFLSWVFTVFISK